MGKVSVNNIYLEMLRALGVVDAMVEEAVRRYIIDKYVEKLENAKAQLREFEKQYNCQYEDFCLLKADETKFEKIEKKHPTWEADEIEWEFWQNEFEEWKTKLEYILMRS